MRPPRTSWPFWTSDDERGKKCKNLIDEDYASQTSAISALIGRDFYFLAAPRTHGATIRYDF